MANKKSSGIGWMAILILVAFLGAAVVSYYWASGWGRSKHKGSAIVIKRPVITPLPPLSKVTIYVPQRSGKGVYLAPVVKSAESKNGPLDAAIEALLAANKENKALAAVIPPATKLLTPIKVKRGAAEVNFSKQLIEDFSGGSEEEALALNSIAHTLVKNSSGRVSKVRILVEGKPAESLGGHFDLTEPVSPDSAMLKPER